VKNKLLIIYFKSEKNDLYRKVGFFELSSATKTVQTILFYILLICIFYRARIIYFCVVIIPEN